MGSITNQLSRRRASLGLKQVEVALQAGITRQSLSGLEAGHSVPSISVALRLAQVLQCRVDELFQLEGTSGSVIAQCVHGGRASSGPVAHRPGRSARGRSRAAVGFIAGRWVAHPLSHTEPQAAATPADGLVDRLPARDGPVKVRLMGPREALKGTVFCAGCAPALGILAQRARGSGAEGRVVWLDRPSTGSLQMLAAQEVHVAGAHLLDDETGEFNVPEVRRRFAGRSMTVVHLLDWEVGIAVAAGNPHRLRGVEDLARPGVTVVARASGAAVQQRVERLLAAAGLPPASLKARGPVAESHLDAARWVSLGVADAALTLQSAAESFGLGFVPLARERFDLVLSTSDEQEPRLARLLDTVASRAFRQDAEALGGLSARSAGSVIARTA